MACFRVYRRGVLRCFLIFNIKKQDSFELMALVGLSWLMLLVMFASCFVLHPTTRNAWNASTSEGATYTSFPAHAAHPAGPAHMPPAPGSAAAPAMPGPVPGAPAVPMPVTGMPMPMPVTAGAWCN